MWWRECWCIARNSKGYIVNAFGTLDWVTKEGWSWIPRKWSKDVTKEASSNNIVDKAFGKELFKFFLLESWMHQDQNSFKSTANYCCTNNESSTHYGSTSWLTHPQLLAGLKCESQTENSERTRSWSTFPSSQHYRGVEGCAGAPGGD